MKYKKITQICSAVLVATSLASVPMMTMQSNVRADVTKENDNKAPDGAEIHPYGGEAEAEYIIKTDTTEYKLPYTNRYNIDSDEHDGKAYASWYVLKLPNRLTDDYEYTDHPEFIYQRWNDSDHTNFIYTISRKYSVKPDKNKTPRSVKLKYVDPSGKVLKTQTLNGTQGQTINVKYDLPNGWYFDGYNSDLLFVAMPNGTYTFATKNSDITIPVIKADQSNNSKDRVKLTVHYLNRDKRELDHQDVYVDPTRFTDIPLKYAPSVIDVCDNNNAEHTEGLVPYDDWVKNEKYFINDHSNALDRFGILADNSVNSVKHVSDIYYILNDHSQIKSSSDKSALTHNNGKTVKQNTGSNTSVKQNNISNTIDAKANQSQMQKPADNKQSTSTSSSQNSETSNNTPQNNTSTGLSTTNQAPTSSAKSDSTQNNSAQPDNTQSDVNSALTHSDNTQDDSTPDDSNQTPDDVQNTANPKEGKIEAPEKSLKKSDSSVAPSKDKKTQKAQSINSSAPSTKPAEKVVTPNRVIKNKVLPQTGESNVVLPAILTGLGSLIALIGLLFKHQKNN